MLINYDACMIMCCQSEELDRRLVGELHRLIDARLALEAKELLRGEYVKKTLYSSSLADTCSIIVVFQ